MSSKNLTIVKDLEFAKRFAEACGTDKPAEIERKYGIAYHTAKNYLEGRLPAADILKDIRSLTNVQIDWLLTGEGDKFISKETIAELSAIKASEDAHQDDIDALEVYLENYEDGDELLVTPAQKIYLGVMEDYVLEIIRQVVPQIVRNEMALANGEKLSRKSKMNGAPSFEIGNKKEKENKAA